MKLEELCRRSSSLCWIVGSEWLGVSEINEMTLVRLTSGAPDYVPDNQSVRLNGVICLRLMLELTDDVDIGWPQ